MNKKILVCGSANADFLLNLKRMPKLGETVSGEGFCVNAGGKGLNQAVAVSKLGGDVQFLGIVGNDENGKMLINKMKEYNISFEGIVSEENITGIAIVTVVNGDNFIMLEAGANGSFSPSMAEEKAELIKNADIVVLQLEIPVETVVRICEIAKESATTVILNPAPFKELPENLLSMVDYIIPNEYEAESLTGIACDDNEGVKASIEAIKAMGVKNVIITLGERGCAYTNENEVLFNSAMKSNVVDTTSAGDTFIGALCSKLSKGESVTDAIAFATKASAITVSRKGAAQSIPYENEIV